MARLAQINSPSIDDEGDGRQYPDSTTGPSRPHRDLATLSPSSPEASDSSDKENHGRRNKGAAAQEKDPKSRPTMTTTTPGLRTPNSNPSTTPRATAGRKRRFGESDAMPSARDLAHERELAEVADTKYYDPDQDMEERRMVRKGFRDLTRELNESRAEYLAPGDSGLVQTLHRANEFFSTVKQTSDATLDSRLLVSTADLSYKKTAQLTLGDAAQGIDVDEFVSKCITFMRRGPETADHGNNSGNSSQRRRRRRTDHANQDPGDAEEDDDDDNEGDAFNWEHLGRRACFPHNVRPPVPGFLLGPLSLQKRTRAARARQGKRQTQRNAADAVQAQELKASDLEKAENSNLTILCTRIREVLCRVQKEGEDAVEAEADDSMSPEDVKALMDKYAVCSDGGVSFFKFVTNPTSFGQTVENLFYVSFLIRDGSVGVGEDEDGFPTLHPTTARKIAEIKQQGIQKHQAVFHLDYKTWREIIDVFGVTGDPVIPDRASANEEEEGRQVGEHGWYA
ncbi:MAG: nuclear protein [Peltula sp. TS41687]|nr:MAG: nuclear protein [Peltula sp. TS41687]